MLKPTEKTITTLVSIVCHRCELDDTFYLTLGDRMEIKSCRSCGKKPDEVYIQVLTKKLLKV